MAQVQHISAASNVIRPNTPPERLRPLKAPRMSPSRIPDPGLASPSYRSAHFHLDTFSPVNQNGSFEFDRVIKSGKVLRRIKKKGAWKPSWKPAYLVLRPNLLSVYKDEKESELKAGITLSEVTAVARVKKTNTDNVFGIFTPAKNYHFSGSTERETSDWITLIRTEARTNPEENLDLPAPGMPTMAGDTIESETTDMSEQDDGDRPGSPEAYHWAVRGNKSRSSTQTGQRKLSNLRGYSANEQYTTSQSDFSDVAATKLSTSIPRNKPLIGAAFASQSNKLTTIPSDRPLPPPSAIRSASQTSLQGISPFPPPQSLPATISHPSSHHSDPNRVIRQGPLNMHKTGSGVRQWKTVWGVLRPSGLALYKSTSEYEPIKIMPITSLIDAAEIDPISRSKRHCLQVIGEEKTYKFNVDSEGELEGWLGALKSVLVKQGRGIGSSHGSLTNMATVPLAIPGSSDRLKDNVVSLHSPPNVNRSARADPVGLQNIVEGVDELKIV